MDTGSKKPFTAHERRMAHRDLACEPASSGVPGITAQIVVPAASWPRFQPQAVETRRMISRPRPRAVVARVAVNDRPCHALIVHLEPDPGSEASKHGLNFT